MCGDLIRSDCRRLVIVRNKRNERKRQHCGNYEAKLHKTCLLNLQPGLTRSESESQFDWLRFTMLGLRVWEGRRVIGRLSSWSFTFLNLLAFKIAVFSGMAAAATTLLLFLPFWL